MTSVAYNVMLVDAIYMRYIVKYIELVVIICDGITIYRYLLSAVW